MKPKIKRFNDNNNQKQMVIANNKLSKPNEHYKWQNLPVFSQDKMYGCFYSATTNFYETNRNEKGEYELRFFHWRLLEDNKWHLVEIHIYPSDVKAFHAYWAEFIKHNPDFSLAYMNKIKHNPDYWFLPDELYFDFVYDSIEDNI